jgi:hypothetical protein
MKTVTGLFDDYTDASAAVSALEARGIPSSDISIVSNNAGTTTRKATAMPLKVRVPVPVSVLSSAAQVGS